MRKKTIRRMLAVALAVALLAAFSSTASAATWRNMSGSTVVVNWTYYNFPSEYQTLVDNIANGQNYWSSSCDVRFTRYYGEYINLVGTQGGLVHLVPLSDYWTTICGDAATARSTYAFTKSIDPSGNEVDIYLTSQVIQSSIIYYNPLKEAIMPWSSGFTDGFTIANYKCLVAHEFGHCIGFFHPTEDPDVDYSDLPSASIMYQGKLSLSELTTYDITKFNAKY